MELDRIDKNILNILQSDAKITNTALAQRINLSPAATLERVKKLEQHELIKGYGAQLNHKKLGLGTEVILAIRLQRMIPTHIEALEAVIDKIPEITTCYQVVGSFDFILTIQASNLTQCQQMIIEQLYILSIVDHITILPITQLLKKNLILLR